MLRLTNYHTHSQFCDGKEAPEEYIKAAIDAGFDAIGFSSHAPLPFENKWSIKPGMMQAYAHEIQRLKKCYAGEIKVFLGLEIDYVPGLSTPFSTFRNYYALDFVIGGVHLVASENTRDLWFIDGHPQGYDDGLKNIFHMDIKRGVDCYFTQLWDMILNEKFDVLAHADKIKMNNRGLYFSIEEPWYLDYIRETVKLIAKKGCIVEVNTRGIYKNRFPGFYPSVQMLEALFKKNVPVTISTDAHHPSEIALQWTEALQCIRDIGYRNIMVLEDNGWRKRKICS